ncbi:MAG TPA: AMP-binding protein [Acidimicrobiia bacterium]|nr:AMP-binding protein [Acidimicrobiia bacterium]
MYESFATVWERVADAIPDAEAVVQGERRVTYREVEDRAARLASALAAAGVGHDSKVALFLYNCPEYMELLFALSKLRAAPANVNFRYLGDELVQLVDNADAEVLVYHRSLRDRVDAVRDRMPRLRRTVEIDDDQLDPAGDSEYEELIRAHEPAPRIERSGDDLLLWYTGGTTGLPKGVLWHQGALLGYGLIAAYALQDETPADSLDRLIDDVSRWRARGTPLVSLLTTPLVHATAVHQANTAFAVGGTIVLLERGRTDGDTICQTIVRERPSVLEIVGDVLMRRIATALDDADARGEPYDVSSLQRIHNSGAMVSAPLKDALLSRGTMHVYDSLGSSEAVGFGVALTTEAGSGHTARFRIGPNARLLVGADRDEQVEAGSAQVGVLAVHTSCATGYYKDPARTAATFRVIDGRLHAIPGDQATLDRDGTLTLLGRGSNCINSGGEKVWPEEVEEVLKEHPGVADAVVLGVPDDEWGQVVAAVVSTTGDHPPDADALGDWVGARLAGYKRPRRFVFADEVGRNTVGKLDYEWARRAVT